MADLSIRKATFHDLPALVPMARRFYATTDYRAIAPEPDDQALANIGAGLIRDGVFLVAERGGAIVGMVGLLVTPFAFAPVHRTAHEVMWWVEPDAQGAGAGRALLEAAIEACRNGGIRAIQMLHLATSPPHAAEAYRAAGFVHSESSYMKVLE